MFKLKQYDTFWILLKSSILYTKAEMIHKLGEEMGTKLAKAEDLGAEGLVVESLQLMEEVENLKKQKAAAEVCLVYRL